MAKLTLNLLGGFQAWLDGEPIPNFTSDKTRALLAYLVVEALRPHRRESLCALLWPNATDSLARQSLSQALSVLRKVLRDNDDARPFLLADRDTVQFNPRSDYALDTDYRGPFLDGFTLPDADGFDEWVLVQREALQREALEKLDGAIALDFERGRHDKAIEAARKQLEIDPWREESHRSLMHAYAATGQRGDALAQFEKCKQVLRDALGVAPSAETKALAARIQQDQIHVRPAANDKARLNVFELPATLTPFVGREEELAALSGLLANPDARLITLVGMGGMGKTRLAIEAAARARGIFDNGVAFVPLAAVAASDEAIAGAICAAMRLNMSRSETVADDLFAALRNQAALLILDNADHHIGANTIAFVTRLLQVAPSIKLLVTSREALEAPGEWLFDVHGLGGDARALFAQCAQRARANARMRGEDESAVQRICDLVGGMPLGVELAASWTRTLSCAEIAEELERGLEFLKSNSRQIPERHRSITAVLNHAWAMLSNSEQRSLKRLAQFNGGFTREAAAAVAGAELSLLSMLISKALVRRVDARRYDLHELIRQFALERSEDRLADADAHADYFAAFAAENGYVALASAHHDRFVEIGNEHSNIEAACAHLLAAGKNERAAQMLGSLLTFVLFEMYDSAFGIAWVARVRERLVREQRMPAADVQVQLLAAQLTMLSYTSDVTVLADELDAALDRLRTQMPAATHTLAYGCEVLAWVRIRQGRVDEATSGFVEAIPHFRQVKDAFGLGLGLRGMSVLLMARGDVDGAQRVIRECVAGVRSLDDPRMLALALGGQAECERALGELREAISHYEESARLFDKMRDSQSLLMCKLNHLGAYVLLGWRDEAAALAREVAAMVGQSGGLPRGHNCASALLNFAGCELLINDAPERGAALLSASAEVFQRHGSKPQPADKRTYDHIHADLTRRLTDDRIRELMRSGSSGDPEELLRETLERFRNPS